MLTIRVYGLLINKGKILVSDETIRGRRITKFPGGGLEYGEGLKDCLVREVREEIGIEAIDLQHFYTTDFFQQSSFHSSPMQVVSVYYRFSVQDPGLIPVAVEPFNGEVAAAEQEVFRWVPVEGAADRVLTLPIDRVVWDMLVQR